MGKKKHRKKQNKPTEKPDEQALKDNAKMVIPEKKEDEKKDRAKRIALYLGIFATALTIVMALVFEIPEKIGKLITPSSAKYYGVVQDESGNPVSDATIRVFPSPESDKLLGTGNTQPNGEFNIVVKAKPESQVWVVITLEGDTCFAGFQILAGSNKPPCRKRR